MENVPRNSFTQKYIAAQIDRALSENDLPYDSPIRGEIEARVDFVGSREPELRVRDCAGTITIGDYIKELSQDTRFADCFPPEPPRVSRTDTKNLRVHFDSIRTGTVIVE